MKPCVAAAVCAVMVGLIPAAGCASDPLPVASTTNIDLSDPEQVIANALATMFTWNPISDASPDAAYRRASIYLSGDLAQQADKAAKPALQLFPGSRVEVWVAARWVRVQWNRIRRAECCGFLNPQPTRLTCLSSLL